MYTLEHPGKVLDAAFVATGESVLTGCADGKVRFWDIASRRVLRQFDLELPVNAVAASTDGRTLAAGGFDRTISLWDAVSGQLLDRQSERQSGLVHDIAFRPDGRALAVGLGDGTTEYVDVAYPVEGEVDELALWSKVVSNARLDDDGSLVRLDHSEWSKARQALTALQRQEAQHR